MTSGSTSPTAPLSTPGPVRAVAWRAVTRAVPTAFILLALAVGCGGSDDEEPAPSTSTSLPTGSLADGFYPVLTVEHSVCGAGNQHHGDLSNEYCYTLSEGDHLPVTDVVESAETALDEATGTWVVRLTLTEQGIAQFNALASRCYVTDAEVCPTGQIAIVGHGAVVSAPTIQQPAFERDQIQVAGNYTENDVEMLVDAFEP